jgi:ubiquinone/menaquinone biosynthesis C-methylase UbiE
MSAMSPSDPHAAALWSADVARNYAAVRSDLAPAVRSVWVETFRSAVPAAPRRRLLDVGCGTGRFTALLAEVFASPTIGVDGSPAMLGECPRPAGAPLAYVGADAAALPLGPASVDLALLSMIYHLLAPAGPAVAELHRVVRPSGWVLVRTPTAELTDRVSFMPFFPEARAVDEARIPPRARVTATFEGAGFVTHAHRTIEQELANSPAEALEKVRRRVYSTLRLISEDAFATGLARYEAHCLSAPPGPLIEPLDFFVFHRA